MAQNLMYVKDNCIYAKDYLEMYIPLIYFGNKNDSEKRKYAIDRGEIIEVFALVYVKGVDNVIQFMNVPTRLDIKQYDWDETEIEVHEQKIQCRRLKFMKDAYICSDTVIQNFNLGEDWVNMLLDGKVPSTINYPKLINIWWNNCEITGIDLQCHTKIMELIICNLFRNKDNLKERYAKVYGNKSSPEGYDYKSGDVRSIVEQLSTFSGFIFEDIGRMITSGINNSLDNIEEKESPLEKVMKS